MNEPNYLRVKINPRASKNAIMGHMDDEHNTLKISVTAAPEKGKANEAVIKLLSQEYQVPKSNIKIISGHSSQIKLIRIDES
jgi:hypothetical protein